MKSAHKRISTFTPSIPLLAHSYSGSYKQSPRWQTLEAADFIAYHVIVVWDLTNEHPSGAVRISVYMPAQLEEGTEVYVINEIPTSYSFVRRAIPCGYLPTLLLYTLVLDQYFIHTRCCTLGLLTPTRTIVRGISSGSAEIRPINCSRQHSETTRREGEREQTS